MGSGLWSCASRPNKVQPFRGTAQRAAHRAPKKGNGGRSAPEAPDHTIWQLASGDAGTWSPSSNPLRRCCIFFFTRLQITAGRMRVITPIKYGLLCRDHIHNMKNTMSPPQQQQQQRSKLCVWFSCLNDLRYVWSRFRLARTREPKRLTLVRRILSSQQ